MKNYIVPLSGVFCVTMGGVVGCADDEQNQQDCVFVHSPEECSDKPTESEGNDEVGDGDEAAEREPSCTAEPDGIQRTVFQCNGQLTAIIQFQALDRNCAEILGDSKLCEELHEFGAGFEHYEMPAVMACCDADGVPDDEILAHCAADMVDQVCRSIPMRVQKLIDGKWLDNKKVAKDQAQALQNWLEDHTQECRKALLHHSDDPGTLEPRSFKVPNSLKWVLLKDFTITLTEAVVESATLPEDPAEHLPCDDAYFNNSEVFEAKLPLFAGRNVEAPRLGAGHSMAFALSGVDEPVFITSTVHVNGQPVTGTGTVASVCDQPRCSSLVVAEHAGPGMLAVEELELFADGPVRIDHGPLPVDLDGAALRLYGASPAEYIRIDGAQQRRMYVVAPHDAQFVISGAVVEHKGVRWASNDTPIYIFVSVDEVSIFGFVISHTDGSGNSWAVHVPGTAWK